MARAPSGKCFPDIEEIRKHRITDGKGKRILPVLALDLSSSSVGWAVGHKKKVKLYGKFVFKSTAGVGEKLVSFEDFITDIIDSLWPKQIVLERPISRRGATTGRHHEVLGIVRKVWYAKTGAEISDEHLIPPTTIKRALAVQRGRTHEENKRIMVAKINQLYGLKLQYDKNSKYKSDDDTADAIAVLATYWKRTGGRAQ